MQTPYRRLIVNLREEITASQSRILVKGKVVPNKIPENPDVCPFDCKKKRDRRFIEPQRTLLTRHHADKRIGLFCCDGCPPLLFKSLIIPIHEAPNNMDLHENVKIEHAVDNSIMLYSTETPSIVPIHSVMSVERKMEYKGPSPTAMNKDFIMLTETLYKNFHTRGFHTRGFNLICCRCSRTLEVGDLYHRAGARIKKFYCVACWQTLLH